MTDASLRSLAVGIKGAGEMATGVAWRLWRANIRNIFMMEIARPLAVRREVAFCEAVYDGEKVVDGVPAVKVESKAEITQAWAEGHIAVIVDPAWEMIGELSPQVVIDAILAKTNLGTAMDDAPLVIGMGPGFEAGRDVHVVIETNRGHNLGRLIFSGAAEADTGIPGEIGGYTTERVLRAPCSGIFTARRRIGEMVRRGEPVGDITGTALSAGISGILRGLLRDGTEIKKDTKLGDIDPRGELSFCVTVSDKALAIGGAALEAVCRAYNK